MAYRFTNTEKWNDVWFSELKLEEKLLFIYLCENCDCAGFIELNLKRIALDINSNITIIEGALKGLERGLIFSADKKCCFVINFLKHQKNLPLNQNNKAHIGILKRFHLYSQKFNIQSVNEFIEGANKGLQSPLGIGIGIGIGNDNGNGNNDFVENNFGSSFSPIANTFEKSIDECKKEYILDTILIEQVCINLKLTNVEILALLDTFTANLISEGVKAKTISDFKAHFFRWAKIQKDNQKASASSNWTNYKQGQVYKEW